MTVRARLLAAFIAVLALPLAIALLIADAPLATELVIFGVAVLLGVGLALLTATAFARPIAALTRAAEQAARGDISARVDIRTSDELGRLGRSLNILAEHLRRRSEDVAISRDELRESVRRLGEALRSTHDLMKLLSVVLETALVAVKGKSGAVFLLSSRRAELLLKVGRHVDPSMAERTLPLGHGLAGWVAENKQSVRLPSTADGPVPADPEPVEPTAIAVPLESQSQLLGVLAIYGRQTLEPFREEDLDTIESLARQAGVGIDNVLLHQEAERLSITDGLTSIWNLRYAQMRLSQELASAKRFNRQVSLIWIDCDDFKDVNDRYGHQRGDSILIELASRVASTVREIDTFARYGGEEFIVVLPEIDANGARIAAERIKEEVTSRPFGDEGEVPIPVTVSLGFATYPDHAADQRELLKAADQAMYVAKSRGKDQVVGADDIGDEPSLAPDRTAH